MLVWLGEPNPVGTSGTVAQPAPPPARVLTANEGLWAEVPAASVAETPR